MIPSGIILMILGLIFCLVGADANNDLESQLESMFDNGSTDPGDGWIIIGIIMLVIGFILLIVGLTKRSEDAQEEVYTPSQNACPNCGALVSPLSHGSCLSCGHPLNSNGEQRTLICTHCEKSVPAESNYCLYCGEPMVEKLLIPCPHCGEQLPKDSRFCCECGLPIPQKEADAITICPLCGETIPAKGKFCVYCGGAFAQPTPLPLRCAHCGTELKPNAHFCAACGQPTE